jgi:hypothetical protein
MNAKVKVVGDAQGNVINQSSNPLYGHVKVVQIRTVFDDKGFMRARPVNALIHGTIEDLKLAGYYAGQELPGKVIINESLEPFNTENPERDLKIAGKTGIICSVEGNPIYRKTVYSPFSNAEDTLIQHDNVEALREAYEAEKATGAVKPNQQFDI